ncbi:MAG: hypothetical protein U9N35_01850 [Euryarchaeota archaeon]|nr:hypothetical protein [Euryarchaeota archaeon]
MKVFIATLGVGKGTWGHVGRLMQEEWDEIILISNEWTKERFSHEKDADWIEVNSRGSVNDMIEEIGGALEGLENVHINVTSGSGKEHMALLMAMKEKDLDYKFCVLTDDGVRTV